MHIWYRVLFLIIKIIMVSADVTIQIEEENLNGDAENSIQNEGVDSQVPEGKFIEWYRFLFFQLFASIDLYRYYCWILGKKLVW